MKSGNFAFSEVLGWSALDEDVVVIEDAVADVLVSSVGGAVVVGCVSATPGGGGADSDGAVTGSFSCAAVCAGRLRVGAEINEKTIENNVNGTRLRCQ
jgi:hypothetical protein